MQVAGNFNPTLSAVSDQPNGLNQRGSDMRRSSYIQVAAVYSESVLGPDRHGVVAAQIWVHDAYPLMAMKFTLLVNGYFSPACQHRLAPQ